MRAVYGAASAKDPGAAGMDQKFSLFAFTPAVGTFFTPGRLPKTEAFFKNIQQATEVIEETAKNHWKRPRPYVADPTLLNGKVEKSFSYPSGHSLRGTVFALVLAELFPAQSEAILAEGRAIGWHRVELARHYPTDIYAGRVLAQAIVRELKADANFQKDLVGVKAEIAAVKTTSTN